MEALHISLSSPHLLSRLHNPSNVSYSSSDSDVQTLGHLWFLRKYDAQDRAERSRRGETSTEHTVGQLHLLNRIILSPHGIISVFGSYAIFWPKH